MNVRFDADSGLKSDIVPCPKSAKPGSRRCYSITSSARARSVGGILRPIVKAAVKSVGPSSHKVEDYLSKSKKAVVKKTKSKKTKKTKRA
jgi:hypothetical protein